MSKNNANNKVNSNMNVKIENNNNKVSKGDNMSYKAIFDKIEENVNDKIGKNYFEVLDDEMVADGYLIIETDEFTIEEVKETVEMVINKIGGVSIDIDEMPSNDDFELTYKFVIDISGVITPQKPFKGDNMNFKLVELDEMSQEDEFGTIVIKTIEDEDFEFDNEYQVLMKLLSLGFDFTKTKIFKMCKQEWFTSSIEEKELFCDNLLSELITDYDEIFFNNNKNIVIEEVVVDCSFDYDYGSISSTHICYGILGYNVFVEDID